MAGAVKLLAAGTLKIGAVLVRSPCLIAPSIVPDGGRHYVAARD
jgi:hypothetical protein